MTRMFVFLASACFVAILAPAVTGQDPGTETGDVVRIESAQLQLIVDVSVAARDPGIIQLVRHVEGQEVRRGDVLVELDSKLEAANFGSAESELAVAKEESENDIDLRYAKVSQEVSGKVYQRSVDATKRYAKSVSGTELERLKLEVERARLSGEQAQRTSTINELNVESKRAQLEATRIRLEGRRVVSPVDGVVVQVYRQVGEGVQAAQPVARVIGLEKLKVACRCKLRDASPDVIGSDAVFVYQGKGFPAKVTFVSPEIDPDIQDFVVWAEIENLNRALKPGMQGAIELRTNE